MHLYYRHSPPHHVGEMTPQRGSSRALKFGSSSPHLPQNSFDRYLNPGYPHQQKQAYPFVKPFQPSVVPQRQSPPNDSPANQLLQVPRIANRLVGRPSPIHHFGSLKIQQFNSVSGFQASPVPQGFRQTQLLRKPFQQVQKCVPTHVQPAF
jgi:hypothetical protein